MQRRLKGHETPDGAGTPSLLWSKASFLIFSLQEEGCFALSSGESVTAQNEVKRPIIFQEIAWRRLQRALERFIAQISLPQTFILPMSIYLFIKITDAYQLIKSDWLSVSSQ